MSTASNSEPKAPNRELKARGKASPDKIQSTIRNSTLIRNGIIEDNDMDHHAESDNINVKDLANGNVSVPLSVWKENKSELRSRISVLAVQIASDEFVEDLADDLGDIEMVVLPFVNFVDGRAYSHAHMLRTRYGFLGEIRAIGDVHFDHLAFLARSGCDAFELPDGDDHQAALAAFSEFSEVYQPAADDAQLIFSRRRTKH